MFILLTYSIFLFAFCTSYNNSKHGRNFELVENLEKFFKIISTFFADLKHDRFPGYIYYQDGVFSMCEEVIYCTCMWIQK